MIQNFKTRALLFVVVLCAFTGWIVAGSTTPASLTINDLYTGAMVHSDGNGTYFDHTLSSTNPCVTSWVYSTGLFFTYLDYNPAVGTTGQCDSTLGIVSTPEDRTYSLTFPAASGICTAFGLPESGGECTLVSDTGPRIRAENLFANKPTSTAASFLFYWQGNSYSLHTDNNATISGSGTTLTLTYGSTVTLTLVPLAGGKSQQIGSSFLCPFQYTVSD